MRNRRSITSSELARRYKAVLRDIYRSFQALQFSSNGPYFKWETVHRVSNARLLVDAARRALGVDSKIYSRFRKDVEMEFRTSRDGDETVRYSLKLINRFHEFAPSARLMHYFPYFMAARTWHC